MSAGSNPAGGTKIIVGFERVSVFRFEGGQGSPSTGSTRGSAQVPTPLIEQVAMIHGRFSHLKAMRLWDTSPSAPVDDERRRGAICALDVNLSSWSTGVGSIQIAEGNLTAQGFDEAQQWDPNDNYRARSVDEARGWRHVGQELTSPSTLARSSRFVPPRRFVMTPDLTLPDPWHVAGKFLRKRRKSVT